MIFCGRKFEVLLVCLVQSAIWSLSTSLPAETGQLSALDHAWYRRTTTRKRYIWERSTTSSYDYDYKHSSSATDPMFWIIVGGSMFLALIVVFLKYLCEGCSGESSETESSATLHPPPARIIPPPSRPSQPYENTSRSHNTGNLYTSSGGAGHEIYQFNSGGVSSTFNSRIFNLGDRPPGYSDVVTSDFTDGSKRFPEVSPKPLETPPPNYVENLPPHQKKY